MNDKIIDKIAILAKLSAISDIQLKLQQDRNQLEEELREIEEYERKSNHQLNQKAYHKNNGLIYCLN